MPLKLIRRGEIWHYTGTVAKQRLRGSTKTSQKREAEKVANEVESRYLQSRRDPGSVLTFAQAAHEYRKVRGAPRYLELVEDHWRDTPIKDITRGGVKRAAVELLPNSTGSYRNRAVVTPTQAVINYAASLDLCSPIRVDRFQVVTKRKDPATREWIAAFMAHSSPHLGALACFMFGTGARISEALDVKWRDVDLSAGRVKIRMGKLGGEERVAHLPAAVVAAIANIPSEREAGKQVFPYASYRSLADPWEVAIRRAGIKRLTCHCCRHGFATTLMHAGIDPVTVAKRGGWKDPAQLFRTYGHAMDDETVTDLLFDLPRARDENTPTQGVDSERKKA